MPDPRSVRRQLRPTALAGALALGVLADALFRAEGRPGLNWGLWALAGVAVLGLLLRLRAEPPARTSMGLVAAAAGFAFALMLRDAEALAVFAVFAGALLLFLAAAHATGTWSARAHLSELAFSVLRIVVLLAMGPLGWGRAERAPGAHDSPWSRRTRTLLRGTAMALPPLLLLGALLMSADPVFDHIVRDSFRIDVEELVGHLALTAIIAWLSAGYLRAFLLRDDDLMSGLRLPRPALAAEEVSVALWILNGMFLVFLAVQVRYLFGGSDVVEVTAGLTYADYARRGFFELAAAAALVVPLLLVGDWIADPEPSRARRILRATMLVLVALLVGIIASAAYRMKLYQDAYGLTEQRLYVSVIIVWLTAVLVWLSVTVLRGARERFASGIVVAGLVCIAGLHVLNPHALIARVNLDRAADGREYDGTYLRALSADAVPVILDRLDRLPVAARCDASRMLLERWSGDRPGGWRTWNLSDWRARRLIAPRVRSSTCPAP